MSGIKINMKLLLLSSASAISWALTVRSTPGSSWMKKKIVLHAAARLIIHAVPHDMEWLFDIPPPRFVVKLAKQYFCCMLLLYVAVC